MEKSFRSFRVGVERMAFMDLPKIAWAIRRYAGNWERRKQMRNLPSMNKHPHSGNRGRRILDPGLDCRASIANVWRKHLGNTRITTRLTEASGRPRPSCA